MLLLTVNIQPDNQRCNCLFLTVKSICSSHPNHRLQKIAKTVREMALTARNDKDCQKEWLRPSAITKINRYVNACKKWQSPTVRDDNACVSTKYIWQGPSGIPKTVGNGKNCKGWQRPLGKEKTVRDNKDRKVTLFKKLLMSRSKVP